MGMWKYTLKSGRALRDAIDDDNNVETLNCLADCFKEINSIFPTAYDSSDLEEDLDDIENIIDNLENYEDYDMTYSDVLEQIDWTLDKFYDICDDLRIWVNL